MRIQRSYTLCLCLLLALAGCHPATSLAPPQPTPTYPPQPAYVDPIAFHETIGKADQNLYDASAKVGYAERDAIADKPDSIHKLDAAWADAQKALSDENTMAKTIKVPDDPSSQTLFAAFQKYLKGQNSVSANEMAKSVQVAKNKKLTAKAKTNQVLALLKTVKQKTESDYAAWQAADATFVTEHHMMLK